MKDLFGESADIAPDSEMIPLAERLRPMAMDEIIGQEHLCNEDGTIGRMIAQKRIHSLILWGPPGCGKTTIARLLAGTGGLHYSQISAIFTGVAELRTIFAAASNRRQNGQATLLFVDEIHRFNRAQQDAFLPYLEDGTLILLGATTENPSFALNPALLSRCGVAILQRLDAAALEVLLQRAENALGQIIPLQSEARASLLAMADGDGRFLLNMVERLYPFPEAETKLGVADLARLLQQRAPLYDKGDEAHYNLVSALHKSVRGSDADAALYWLARMLAGGEDPHFIARRLVRMAVEDIGLADPQALPHAMAAWQCYERLGSPEGELALVNSLIYLATAPKSNAAYSAFKQATQTAQQHGSLSPPLHILNAPTKFMRQIGYGAGYEYDHDAPDGFSGQDYFPAELPRSQFYVPVQRGFEREISKRLDYWQKLRHQRAETR